MTIHGIVTSALVAAYLSLCAIASCPQPDPEPPKPPIVPDAAPPPVAPPRPSPTDLAADACKNLNARGCRQASDCEDAILMAIATNAIAWPTAECLANAGQPDKTCGAQVRCNITGDAGL